MLIYVHISYTKTTRSERKKRANYANANICPYILHKNYSFWAQKRANYANANICPYILHKNYSFWAQKKS